MADSKSTPELRATRSVLRAVMSAPSTSSRAHFTCERAMYSRTRAPTFPVRSAKLGGLHEGLARRCQIAGGPERLTQTDCREAPQPRIVLGQQREGSAGKLDRLWRISSNVGVPRANRRGVSQQMPAASHPGGSSVGHVLGLPQERFDVVRPSGKHQRRGVIQEQLRPAAHRFFGQHPKPTQQGQHLAATPGLPGYPINEACRPLVVLGRQRVPDRFRRPTVLLMPGRRLTVQILDSLGIFAFETTAQEVGEQVMVAVPSTLVV